MNARLVVAAAAIAALSAFGILAWPGGGSPRPIALYAAQATSTPLAISTSTVAHIEEMSV